MKKQFVDGEDDFEWTDEQFEAEEQEEETRFQREWDEMIEEKIEAEWQAADNLLKTGKISAESLTQQLTNILARMSRKTRLNWLKRDALSLIRSIEANEKASSVSGRVHSRYSCEDFHMYIFAVAVDATASLLKWKQSSNYRVKPVIDAIQEIDWWVNKAHWSGMKMEDTGSGSYEPTSK